MDTQTSAWSISIWAKKDGGWSSADTVNEFIFAKYNNVVEDLVELYWKKDDGKIIATCEVNNTGGFNFTTTKTTWAAGTWFHLVLVLDTSKTTGTLKLYVDSVVDGSGDKDTSGDWQAGTQFDFNLNASNGGTTADQYLDEVKVFYGVALSADEVKLIYRSENQDLQSFGAEEEEGWTGKISGITNPAKVMGVDKGDIANVKGI